MLREVSALLAVALAVLAVTAPTGNPLPLLFVLISTLCDAQFLHSACYS